MSSFNNRLSTPICLHRKTPGNRRGFKTFLRGKAQRECKSIPKRWDGIPRKELVDGRPPMRSVKKTGTQMPVS